MKNILIVEDEKFVRKGIKLLIERTGLCSGEIVDCKNGQEAVEKLKASAFDLIITDIKMPIMDGLAFIDCVRKENLSDAPIVILSGYDDFTYAVEALRRGAREYLLKPLDRDAFTEMLKTIEGEIEARKLNGVKELSNLEDEESKQQKINKAVEFIKENYNSDINMAVVSNYVSMNYTFFSEAFKEITGASFVEYLKSVRINMAKRLLKSTNLKISKISAEVGYNDEKHFFKTFKAETGFTPSEYRGKYI